jgi:hypothetical protein
MRQLSPLTNVVLACVSAFALVVSVGLPWFAPPSAAAGATIAGTDALGSARSLVLILAAAVVVLSVAVTLPAVRTLARDALRAVAIATPLLVLALAMQRVGGGQHEVRWGLLVTLGLALLVATTAWHAGDLRDRRAPNGSWARGSAR